MSSDLFISAEMEAEGVTDFWSIPLGDMTRADKVTMQSTEGHLLFGTQLSGVAELCDTCL